MTETTSSTSRPPALPSTADTVPYVPVSWVAAGAATVALVFVITLVSLGYYAFKERKPLIEDWLLVFPVVGFVLCFAARRMIQNSEGTRTGMLYGVDLVNSAWWVLLIGGLGYVAYLFAIDFSIRREARSEAQKWADTVRDNEVGRAFYRTLPPGARQGIAPTDDYQIETRFRDELLAFRKSDLLRLAARNKGQFEFNVTEGGIKDWAIKPGVVDCTLSATVKCPEGKFPVIVGLRGIEGVSGSEGSGSGRQWTITRPQSGGFIQQDLITRTPYGWFVYVLELDGGAFGKGFVSNLSAGPGSQVYLYHGFIAPGGDQPGWTPVAVNPLLQLAFAVPLGANPPRGILSYDEYRKTELFRLPGGRMPNAGQVELFDKAWDIHGLKNPGSILKAPDGSIPDKEDELRILPDAVEVHVPVELPVVTPGGKPEAARGRVIVRCTDPTVLAELKQLREAAQPDAGTNYPPPEMERRRTIPWRVVRIESDMVPISTGPPGGSMRQAGAGP